jgi:hypothetical protein
MKRNLLTIVLLSLLGAALPVGRQTARQTSPFLKGDYVEARSCSVFAGACHYNSELMTCGRDAVMAWNVADGSWNNTSLAGVRVMAVVTSDENLADDSVEHRSAIIVDSSASDAQARAVVAALEAECGKSLGEIVSVRRGVVSFVDNDRQYTVSSAGFAAIATAAMPNDECCKMPNNVWYTPLTPLTNRKVGFTKNAASFCTTLGDSWDRQGENGAFYGAFSF